tara:strand:+ start:504 stop:851 length:348 start_codon:yes stop_codon:yes gene_type:complete
MPSKDQRSINEPSNYEKWDRAKSILLESLLKPDHHLRSCAHNQHCYEDLVQIRDQIVDYVQNMSNPRPFIDERLQIPTLAENTVPVESYVESKSYEYAADITLRDIAKFQRGQLL